MRRPEEGTSRIGRDSGELHWSGGAQGIRRESPGEAMTDPIVVGVDAPERADAGDPSAVAALAP
ncbi:hypothetical protein AQJ91_20150 [Streptomyces dysideae]|uniref:Uncharacterized protein n=1 Tax=Streptomyces dysideae TaxID=909626 RepID=A0A101UYL1_9ACTN|nr:hypothetical protein AQJ91_20150 [Streptomyces dysideae]